MQNETDLLTKRNPEDYASSNVLAREIAAEMLTRLDLMNLKPQVIMDLGCGVGDTTMLLRNRFPNANIIAIDADNNMLRFAKQQKKIAAEWICASVHDLPLQENSVDLLIANLLLPWCDTLEKNFYAWRRILRPDGLFMFTSLGPDTLREMHTLPLLFPRLVDMHDIGDLLTGTGFKDPVLDVDYFTLTYRKASQLFHELIATGMIAGDVQDLESRLKKNNEDVYPITYEVIFGHAFAPALDVDHVADETGVIRIPISHILRRKK